MGSIFGAKVCVRGVKDRNSLVVDIECGGDCSLDEFQEKRHRMLENPDSEVDIEIGKKMPFHLLLNVMADCKSFILEFLKMLLANDLSGTIVFFVLNVYHLTCNTFAYARQE